MDEKPQRFRRLLALVWLPLALLIVVPVVVLLGLSYYVRAIVLGVFGLVRLLFGYKDPIPPAAPMQPPHFRYSEKPE